MTLTGSSTDNSAPADSTIYYFGARVTTWGSTAATNIRIIMPIKGWIRHVQVSWLSTVNTTNEDIPMLLRVNDTTDYPVATVGLVDAVKVFNNNNIGISVEQGDFIHFKFTTPAWVTNPANVATHYIIELEVP
jgi:hypothetical protein